MLRFRRDTIMRWIRRVGGIAEVRELARFLLGVEKNEYDKDLWRVRSVSHLYDYVAAAVDKLVREGKLWRLYSDPGGAWEYDIVAVTWNLRKLGQMCRESEFREVCEKSFQALAERWGDEKVLRFMA